MSREMKDSGVEWIGEIPENWEVKQLRTYFSRRINKNIYLQESNLLSLSYGHIVHKNIDTKEGLLPESFDGYNIIEDGDIVIRGTDLQNDHRSLRTGLVTERGIITSAYITLKPKENVNSAYYHYLLHCYDISKVFYSMGGGLRQSLDYWEVIRMPVLHPTDREQKEIISYIKTKCTAIDTAIEKTKKSIEKLEEYKKAVITKAVTKGIDPNANMKDSGVEWIGKIPENWNIRRIKTVGTYRNGLTYSPDDLTDEANGTLVLRSSNIKGGKLVLQDNLYVRTHISDKLRVQKGDILICSRNGSRALIGKNALIDSDMDASFGAFMMIYRSKGPYYIHWVLKSEMMSYYLASFTTSTINQLIGSDFGNMYLPWPSNIQERQQISNYLNNKCSSIDALVTRKQETINKLEEYKKSLIYYAVTGKIDCRNETIE